MQLLIREVIYPAVRHRQKTKKTPPKGANSQRKSRTQRYRVNVRMHQIAIWSGVSARRLQSSDNGGSWLPAPDFEPGTHSLNSPLALPLN